MSGVVWCPDCEIFWDPVGKPGWQTGEYECPNCHALFTSAEPGRDLGIPSFGFGPLKRLGKRMKQVGSPESRVTALVRAVLEAAP